jgi:hypothetical protein
MKNYVNGTLKPRTADQPKKAGPSPDNDDNAGVAFPGEDGVVHMIFGGSPARPSRRREKLIRREVINTDVTKLSYLTWLEVLITFDREDHTDHVPQPRSYPLVVAPLFKSKRVHNVLMDGGSGINVLYASTLDDMGIPRSALRPSIVPFHEVVPGMEALPIGQIDLPVMFRDVRNFRTETLTFEVVGLGDIPRDPREAGIREVYGHAELYVPETKDSQSEGDHHIRANVSVRIRVRR